MEMIVLAMIVEMQKRENKYLAYTVRYAGDEKDTLIIVPHENFEAHIRYLWNHFYMDGNSYNDRSPVRFIHNFVLCDTLGEIESWLEWNNKGVETWT